MNDWLIKILATIIPLLLTALTTIAWQNSQALSRLAVEEELMRRQLERIDQTRIPPDTLRLQFQKLDEEIDRLRDALEKRSTDPAKERH